MSTEAKTVKEVLIATKYIIEHLDWHQGCKYRDKSGEHLSRSNEKFESELGSVCLLGGLSLVVANEYAVNKTECILRNHFGSPITTFNDAFGQTKEKVIKVLDEVIEAAK
jgi:hypothetical protein